MLSKTRTTPVYSPAPGVIPDSIAEPVDRDAPLAADPDVASTPVAAATTPPAADTARETRREYSRRKAHRSRLYAYSVISVVVVALLIALAVSNTTQVKVDWLVGTSHVSLVWLVLFAAILGWLLGLVATAAFNWQTRAPRQRGRAPMTRRRAQIS